MDIHPPTHVQLKIPIGDVRIYYVEWNANFEIHWESFAHRSQQKKTFLGHATPYLQR